MKKLLLSILSVLCVLSVSATSFKLVESASQLEAGKKYIIVATDYNYAMSTTQNTNNRGQFSITKEGKLINSIPNSVQVLTLEVGTIDGTWAFNTGSSYLCSASSSSNNLKTTDGLKDRASATISISTTGIASIEFKGSYTRNILKYNQSSGVFSCYAPEDTRNDVSLYKEVDTATGVDEIAAENAPVEYYNLLGVKVANPEKGIFIKKQGNKATKVIL